MDIQYQHAVNYTIGQGFTARMQRLNEAANYLCGDTSDNIVF
jgi:hypothetical protein